MVKEMDGMAQQKSIVLYNKEWHKGVVGIVASRLVETFYRPTIVLTESNGYITGSAAAYRGLICTKPLSGAAICWKALAVTCMRPV